MHSIKNITNEITINKSRFITNLFYVETKEEINEFLKKIKDKHYDATHNCYAYIIDNNIQANDDGEPSGTAGKPILNVLEKNKINHVLCIVTRYFGGIKLGAGGLVRAYTKATTEALNKTIITKLTKGYLIELTSTFKYIKKIENLVTNIITKNFNENVIYTFKISTKNYELIKDELNNIGKINIIKEIEVNDE